MRFDVYLTELLYYQRLVCSRPHKEANFFFAHVTV